MAEELLVLVRDWLTIDEGMPTLTRGGSGGGLAVFPLCPFFVAYAIITPQAAKPKPTRMHNVTIISAPFVYATSVLSLIASTSPFCRSSLSTVSFLSLVHTPVRLFSKRILWSRGLTPISMAYS